MLRDWLQASILLALSGVAHAADVPADPTNYTSLLGTLKPGDTLRLAAGTYDNRLNLTNLDGNANAWITVSGPASGAPAVFTSNACCNTVEISHSSYLAVENLTVDGGHIDGAFGLSAKDGTSNRVHDIVVDGCTFINQDGSQQHVAISTKTPTWGWVIRRNRIIGAGTGLYLGNSDGSDPFVGGLIEGNLIRDTIGYNAQIKYQVAWPVVPGMPAGPNVTRIVDNVFIKNDQPSPDGDRPNLLVDRGPPSGPGAMDRFEVYRNLFVHNPRESLIQISGRVSLHDNVFVDVAGNAIRAQDHAPATLITANIYNNTIYAAGAGISFGNAASMGDAVVGNLIFAGTALKGTIVGAKDNLADTAANAANYVVSPSIMFGAMDFYPLAGKCQGSALDLSGFQSDTAYDLDFNGLPKAPFATRGAYAYSAAHNPGWPLAADLKQLAQPSLPDGGAVNGPDGGAVDLSLNDAGGGGTGQSSGCALGGPKGPSRIGLLLAICALSLAMRRRKRQLT